MKIHMHLFYLIGALAASVTDGRIASSSSSSLSQPVGGSAVEVTPNRRDLQPALGTHYCTVTEVGQQRGVVNWQGIDQCHKCEGGQLYWPCGTGNLCQGFCTPKDVCAERLRVAAEGSETPEVSDCTAELEEAEKVFIQKQNVLDTNTLMLIDSLRSEKVAVNKEKEDLEAQVTVVNKENDDLKARVEKLVEAERLFIQEQESLDATTMMVIESLRAEKGNIIAEKDELEETIESLREEKDDVEKELSSFVEAASKNLADKDVEIKSLLKTIEDLEVELAGTTSPTKSPTKSPTRSPTTRSPTNMPTKSPVVIECEVDTYLDTYSSTCKRCDSSFGNYGTSTCGIVGATRGDQCKYPISTCVFDYVTNRMVFAEDIPEIGRSQLNYCYTQALNKGGCDGMFYDPRDDCPDPAASNGVYTKEDFDACTQHKCTWKTSANSPNGPERLCIPA